MEDFTDYSYELDGTEEPSDGILVVEGPSGAFYKVIHADEKDYWESTVSKYLQDYKFTNISDLQDLDRVISMELMTYRYQMWASLEKDYWGESVNVEEMNKQIREISKELRQLKKSLGIEKVLREKDQGDSVAAYIENLRRRAQEFGVMRNDQAVKAITLFQELLSLVTMHDNCTEDERKDNHVQEEDIIQWVRDVRPEFESIDEEFRKTSQKYWIASM